MKTPKILLLLTISLFILFNTTFAQKTKPIVEIKNTITGELQAITIKKASVNSPLGTDIPLDDHLYLKEVKIIHTGKKQYYLVGFNMDKSRQYALNLKKEGENFIHTIFEEAHSCEVKEPNKKVFRKDDRGKIIGCYQGNHAISQAQH